VGVIPAGGGCTQMLCRALAEVPASVQMSRLPLIQKAFETIGLAKVSRSAEEARSLGVLRANDGLSLARDRLIGDAKEVVLGMARAGYKTPLPPDNLIVPGRNGSALFKMGLYSWKLGGQVSEHDCIVGGKLADILCGGDVRPNTAVTEQHILDLEQEAFVSLCGIEKTQARMEYILKNNKPLRN